MNDVILTSDIAANKLVFTATPNATASSGFGFKVHDDGGTANGGVDTDPTANTITLAITSVNDAPSGADKTITTNEDAVYILTTTDFGFTDVSDSPANTLLAVKISTLPTNGTLTLNGTAVTAGQFVSVANIASAQLVFTPAVNANGAAYANFTFQVQDSGGTANGGVDLDQTPNTITFNVNSVNDAPGGTDKTITTLEDASYTFATTDFGFTDVNDSPANNFLSVIITNLPTNGTLKFNGTAVTVNQSILASDVAAGKLVFTPTGNTVAPGSFGFKVHDDGGTANGGVDTDPTANTITLSITSVNDAPAGTDKTIAGVQDVPHTFTAADFGFTDTLDSPANNFLSVIIDNLPTNGVLKLNGTAVAASDVILASDIIAGKLVFTPNASTIATGSFSFQVRDDGGTANGGADTDVTPNTITLTISNLNDAPSGTDKTITTNEDVSYTLSNADFGFNDPNDTPANALLAVKISALPTNGTLKLNGTAVVAGQFVTAANIALGQLVFTPGANANGAAYANFTFQVQDNGGTAGGGIDLDQSPNTITFNVTPVNDAPAGADKTVTTLEDTPYTFANSDFGFTDPSDTPADTLLNVKISTLPTNGALKLNGSAVVAGQLVSAANIAAGQLVFTPALNANGAAYANFTFQVQDTGGTANGGTDLDATPNKITLNVTPVDDAPVLATDAGMTVNEGATATITGGVLLTTDVDTASSSLVYTVTSPVLHGRLEFSTNPGVAVTTFTQSDITSNRLRYVHDGSETTSDSFTFTVKDGTTTLSPSVFNIVVNPVDDPPVIVTNAGATVLEGASVGLTTANLSAADVDTPDTGLTYLVTGVPLHGRVEYIANPGVAITSFTQDDLDNNRIQYVHNGDEQSTDSFTFQLKDATTTLAARTFNINVTPVDDPPVLAADTGLTLNEGATSTITTSQLRTTDVDTSNVNLVYTVTSAAGHGFLQLTTAPGTPITSFTQADIAAGHLQYVHDGSETIADAFTFTVKDATTTLAAATFNITVNPVDDAPVLATNAGATVIEGGSVGLTNANLHATDVDTPDTQLIYTVTGSPLHGRLELVSNPGVAITTFTQNDMDNGLVQYVHNGDEQSTDAFTFTLKDGTTTLAAKTFNISVTPVDDPPVLAADTGMTLNEGATSTITTTMLRTTDVDTANANLLYTVTSVVNHGYLQLTTAVGTPIFSFTQADIAAGHVQYVHDGSETTSDVFTFTVGDATTTLSPANFNINVIPVDDPPVIVTNAGVTVLEGASVGITTANLSATDADTPDTGLIYQVTGAPLHGRLEYISNPGVSITTFTQDDLDNNRLQYVHSGDEQSTDSITFRLKDSTTTLPATTFNISVTPVDDPPVLTTDTGLTLNEGATSTITNSMLRTTDVDTTDANLVYTVNSVVNHGYLQLSTAPGTAIFSFTQADIAAGRLQYVHDGHESTSDAFTFTVKDATTTLAQASFNITIVPVDDPPVLTLNSGITVLEAGTAGITAANLTSTDVDTPDTGLIYQVTGAPLHGHLEFVSNPGVTITSFTQDDVFNNRVQYVHDGSETTSDSFTFHLKDGTTTLGASTFSIAVTPVNDVPIVTNNGLTLNEGATSTLTTARLSSFDPDNTATELVYTITSPVLHGRVELAGNPGVGITSFTQADLNSGLVRYVHDGSETTSDTFSFSVTDGIATVATQAFNINVVPVDDPPVLTVNAGATVLEAGTFSMTTSQLNATDVDTPDTALIYQVTGAPLHGHLEYVSNPGITITSFTQDDLDNSRVQYVHNGDEQSTDSFTFHLKDGTTTLGASTFNITVIPVNDVPIVTNTGLTLNEGGSSTLTSHLSSYDPDNTATEVVYTITSPLAHGIIELAGNPGVGITTFTQADLNAGNVRYVHDGSETTSDTFSFSVTDGIATVPTQAFNINVIPVDDPPVLVNNGTLNLDEGTSAVIGTTLLDATDADTPDGSLVYTITTPVLHGRVELSGNPGVAVTSFTQADLAAGHVVYVHDGGETTSDTFTFALKDATTTLASQVFHITVNPVNDPPSDIQLSRDWFPQGTPVGGIVADLTTTDPDNTNATLTYSIVGAPSIFAVVGDKLVLTYSPNQTTDPRIFTVTLRTFDGQYSFDKTFTISMDVPPFIAPDGLPTIDSSSRIPFGAFVGSIPGAYTPVHDALLEIRYGDSDFSGELRLVSTSFENYGQLQVNAYYGDNELGQPLRDNTILLPQVEARTLDALRLGQEKAAAERQGLALDSADEMYARHAVHRPQETVDEWTRMYMDNPLFKAIALHQKQVEAAAKPVPLAEQMAQEFARNTSQQLDEAARYYQSKQHKLIDALTRKGK